MAKDKYIHIDEVIRQEIIKLLIEGLNHSEISRKLDINRKTIKRVADSTGAGKGRPVSLPDLRRSPTRCPQCGNKVFMPCLQCRIENERKRK